MFTIVYLLFQAIGLVSSVHAILNTRTAQGAIAWVVSLNTLPLITVPIYWVFGRSKFEGYVNAFKNSSLFMDEKRQQAHETFASFVVPCPDDFPEYRAIRKLSLSPFLNGNRVQLLIDGRATFDSIEAGIARARSYILFQFYILRADESGTRFMDLLARKVSKGVDVHVLYDEIGSHDLPVEWIENYRQQGIRIIPFNTTQGTRNRFQINFRNHRKIVVVDGYEAWLGGLNIGDEYLGKDRKLSPWRDTHMHIVGPAALVAQSIFWSDWYWADQSLLKHLQWQPQAAPGLKEGDGQDVLVLGSGPADELERQLVRAAGGQCLPQRILADGGANLLLRAWLHAPEGGAGGRWPFSGGHGELRQPLLPAQFRGDRRRCRRGVRTAGGSHADQGFYPFHGSRRL